MRKLMKFGGMSTPSRSPSRFVQEGVEIRDVRPDLRIVGMAEARLDPERPEPPACVHRRANRRDERLRGRRANPVCSSGSAGAPRSAWAHDRAVGRAGQFAHGSYWSSRSLKRSKTLAWRSMPRYWKSASSRASNGTPTALVMNLPSQLCSSQFQKSKWWPWITSMSLRSAYGADLRPTKTGGQKSSRLLHWGITKGPVEVGKPDLLAPRPRRGVLPEVGVVIADAAEIAPLRLERGQPSVDARVPLDDVLEALPSDAPGSHRTWVHTTTPHSRRSRSRCSPARRTSRGCPGTGSRFGRSGRWPSRRPAKRPGGCRRRSCSAQAPPAPGSPAGGASSSSPADSPCRYAEAGRRPRRSTRRTPGLD